MTAYCISGVRGFDALRENVCGVTSHDAPSPSVFILRYTSQIHCRHITTTETRMLMAVERAESFNTESRKFTRVRGTTGFASRTERTTITRTTFAVRWMNTSQYEISCFTRNHRQLLHPRSLVPCQF